MSVRYTQSSEGELSTVHAMNAVNSLLRRYPDLTPERLAVMAEGTRPINMNTLIVGERPLNKSDLDRMWEIAEVKNSPEEQGRLIFAFMADQLSNERMAVVVEYIATHLPELRDYLSRVQRVVIIKEEQAKEKIS